jgi:secreted trypsin-like serine protease
VKIISVLMLLVLIGCGKNGSIHADQTAGLGEILGDKVTTDDAYASVIQMVSTDSKTGYQSACSGTLYCRPGAKTCRSSRIVKTSAHCFVNESVLQMKYPAISEELQKKGLLRYTNNGMVMVVEPFFSQQIHGIFQKHINDFIKSMKVRSMKGGKLRTHTPQSVQISQKWLLYYKRLLVAMLTGNMNQAQQLAQQAPLNNAQDRAILNLKNLVRDVKIYKTATVQEVKDHLTEGQEITIAGWGLNQDDFNWGVVPWGQNGAHPINNKRLETKVKVRIAHDANNFFYVGEFKDWWFGINAYQNGACSGDSGGGAFMEINGETRHIGTITSIQMGLCGTPVGVTPDGTAHHPENTFHTMILSW